ncbi:hypothetical protein QLQ86_04605 [Halomonas sp. LR5S13]|uniref:hypothetical protein n=1 Tax=Halomonas rhizosphaerae TaxID=3043296 RepID=UPI0024A8474F|nr:hypothetical protein [Halomonas rhizosphaerae]MDI5920069.1 hypothetical protein [Halomonas rhizosphaerae]
MRYMLMRKADSATEAGELPAQGVLEAMADDNNRLLEAGVIMPFGATFWAQGFGMLTDRFGVPWMIGCRTGQCPMSDKESQP